MRGLLTAFILGLSVIGFECDPLGNIIGFDFPEYNIITENDDINVASWKQAEQLRLIQ